MASWARCCNKTLPLTNTIRLHFRDWATSSRRVCSHVHTADCCICVALWGVWKVEPTKAVEGRRPLVANNKLSGSTCLSHAVYCLLCLCSVKYYVYKYYYAYHVYVYIYMCTVQLMYHIFKVHSMHYSIIQRKSFQKISWAPWLPSWVGKCSNGHRKLPRMPRLPSPRSVTWMTKANWQTVSFFQSTTQFF